jgi:hypothetical protein
MSHCFFTLPARGAMFVFVYTNTWRHDFAFHYISFYKKSTLYGLVWLNKLCQSNSNLSVSLSNCSNFVLFVIKFKLISLSVD